MSYFNKFPLIEYTFDGGKTTNIAVDILKRVGFKESIKNTIELFSEYEIIDGETPEMVANKIYGDSSLHWVIMLMNDIVNPYYDWPMSQRTLHKSNSKVKYPGVSLLVTEHTGTTIYADVNFPVNEQIYGVQGNTFDVDDEGNISNVTITSTIGVVNKWNRTFQKIEVVGMSGEFSIGDYVTAFTSDTNGDNIYTVAKIGRIVSQNEFSVHHFADSDGRYLNPLATPPQAGAIGGEQGLLGQTHSSWHDGTREIEYKETILQNYIVDGTDVYTVTNVKYEDDLNESKRSIKIISPKYVSKIIEEFERTIK